MTSLAMMLLRDILGSMIWTLLVLPYTSTTAQTGEDTSTLDTKTPFSLPLIPQTRSPFGLKYKKTTAPVLTYFSDIALAQTWCLLVMSGHKYLGRLELDQWPGLTPLTPSLSPPFHP